MYYILSCILCSYFIAANKEYQEDLGSIEKVVRWQERHTAPTQITSVKGPLIRASTIATSTILEKPVRDENVASSSYGSYPASPSPKGNSSNPKSETILKDFNQVLGKSISASSIDSAGFKTSNSSLRNLTKLGTEHFSSIGGGEFDSGCPGSDRSSTRGLKWLDNVKIGGESQDTWNLLQRRKSETSTIDKQRRNSNHSKVKNSYNIFREHSLTAPSPVPVLFNVFL